MKIINTDLIKDLIISILIVISIALLVAIMCYEEVSLSKIVPEAEEYMLTEEMKENLNTTVTTEEAKETITTYKIEASDLKKYEKTKEYNKGKQNPFAVESDTPSSDVAGNGNSTEQGEGSSNKFYEDEGIK